MSLLRKVARVLTEPHVVTDRLALWRDQADFRRQCGFLAQAGQYEEPGKRVLIVSLSDWAAQVKIEIMLASALRLRGWTPYILTWSTCAEGQRYFRSCGMDRFVFLDEYQHRLEGAQAWSRLADELIAGKDFRLLLNVRYRGVYVGRHVLSTVIRQLRCGRIDLADPRTSGLIKEWMSKSLPAVEAATRILDEINPGVVLFFEKGYSPYGELFDVAVNQGLNTIQYLHTHRADALAFKRYMPDNRHVHPFSLSEQTWRAVQRMPWTEAQDREVEQELKGRYQDGSWFSRKFAQSSKRIKPADEVRRQLGLDPAKKTAVIFSHVLWDATFFFGESLFEDYEEWLVETVKAACANPALNWVVKIHPDYVWKLKAMGGGQVGERLALAQFGVLPPHVKVMLPETDISTCSLFDVADYCLTVRGTIGIEMSCLGIPVLTAGTGRYAGLGFTVDSASREEYLERLRHLHTLPRMSAEELRRARQHAYALLKLRPLAFTAFQLVQSPLERMGHPLDHNVMVKPRSLAELKQAEDLRAFAVWAAESKALDYLPESLADQEPVGPAARMQPEPLSVL